MVGPGGGRSHRAGWQGGLALGLMAALGWSDAAGASQAEPGPVTGLGHRLLLGVTLARSGVIGSGREEGSGIYRSDDRLALTHVGPDHPRIEGITPDPRDPQRWIVAAANGILITPDQGGTWRIATGCDMTEPKAAVVDGSHPDSLFVALPDGIGISSDGGLTWTHASTGIARPYTQALTADRAHPGVLLAATEKGIYRSPDRGETWVLAQATGATVNDLRQSPHRPEEFFAVTQANGGFRSRDGGRSWEQLKGIPVGPTLHVCAYDPGTPGQLALCGWGVGVLISEDGGDTWQDRSAGLPSRDVWFVGSDPDLPGRLYASPNEGAVYASDDFGRTWRKLWFGEGARVRCLAFVPRR